MGRRALAGTRKGAQLCASCRHARLRHEAHGRGPCTHVTFSTTYRGSLAPLTVSARCRCPRFTTTEGMF